MELVVLRGIRFKQHRGSKQTTKSAKRFVIDALFRMEGIQMMLYDKRSNARRYDSAERFFARCIPRHGINEENTTKSIAKHCKAKQKSIVCGYVLLMASKSITQ